MAKRCRLCTKAVSDHSIFCSDHRQQAAAFSVAFGKQVEEAAKSEAPAGEEGADGGISEEAAQGARDELERLLGETFAQVLKWADERDGDEVKRFPQLSIYYLNDRWHARPYYAIVPRGDPEAEAPPSFDLKQARSIFEPRGKVFEAFATHFAELAGELRSHLIQSLDIRFVTYAGVVCICEHTPGFDDRYLSTFVVGGGDVVAVDINDVRDRMKRRGR